ncbi:MAG: hydroxyacylglutathione hydrolase family protein [Euryarchaeota archaeon]|nr:hydroxyacylglutathione hydrolase family protein [Euryarchaeota archaeon]
MSIEQIRVGSDNFSYLIYDINTRKAALVDPGYDTTKAVDVLAEKKLELLYIINTHFHSDHTAANQQIKKAVPTAQVVASAIDGKKLNIPVDRIVSDSEILHIGEIMLTILVTPGHTSGGICIIVDNVALLTGDTLFIGDCGRTDLPGGNLKDMFNTLKEKILPLPDHLIVYPGHDYGEKPFDTLGNQKQSNKTLRAKTMEEFSRIP